MNVTKFTPYYLRRRSLDPFQNLWGEMSTLLDSFSGSSVLAPWSDAQFSPALDVKEDEKNIYVHAELPGLDEDHIDISIKDGVLALKGEKKTEEKKEGENYVRIERSYGSFHRSVALSSDVDESKVDARFKNGVLSITLPKTINERKEQKIKIKNA